MKFLVVTLLALAPMVSQAQTICPRGIYQVDPAQGDAQTVQAQVRAILAVAGCSVTWFSGTIGVTVFQCASADKNEQLVNRIRSDFGLTSFCDLPMGPADN